MGTGIRLVCGVAAAVPLREAGGMDEGDEGAEGASGANMERGADSPVMWEALDPGSLLAGPEDSTRPLGLISLMVVSSCLMVCSRLSSVR